MNYLSARDEQFVRVLKNMVASLDEQQSAIADAISAVQKILALYEEPASEELKRVE